MTLFLCYAIMLCDFDMLRCLAHFCNDALNGGDVSDIHNAVLIDVSQLELLVGQGLCLNQTALQERCVLNIHIAVHIDVAEKRFRLFDDDQNQSSKPS